MMEVNLEFRKTNHEENLYFDTESFANNSTVNFEFVTKDQKS